MFHMCPARRGVAEYTLGVCMFLIIIIFCFCRGIQSGTGIRCIPCGISMLE